MGVWSVLERLQENHRSIDDDDRSFTSLSHFSVPSLIFKTCIPTYFDNSNSSMMRRCGTKKTIFDHV